MSKCYNILTLISLINDYYIIICKTVLVLYIYNSTIGVLDNLRLCKEYLNNVFDMYNGFYSYYNDLLFCN